MGPDHLNTTDQYNGQTALNARNAGQGPRPDLARDNPEQALVPQGLAQAKRQERIKWHTMLTG
eukprot:9595490-Karenia_brevis.AAC.1